MKSVVINSDKSIGYLEEYKGHVLFNLRELDAGTAVKPEKEAYVLEFSADKAEEYFEQQTLTPEEQKAFFEAMVSVMVEGESLSLAFNEAMAMVTGRVFKNAYSRDEERPERPQIELRREDGLL